MKEADSERYHQSEQALKAALRDKESALQDSAAELEKVKQKLVQKEKESETLGRTGKDLERLTSNLKDDIESFKEKNSMLETQLKSKEVMLAQSHL